MVAQGNGGWQHEKETYCTCFACFGIPVVAVLRWLGKMERGYYDTKLANFIASNGGLVSIREQNVTHHYIEGEIANSIRSSWNTLVCDNPNPPISLGESNASVFDRHSMALLSALQGSESFLSVVRKLPDLVTELLDKDLFAAGSQNLIKDDFLLKLLRHQLGVKGSIQPDGMLDHFTHDMGKIANAGDGLTLTTNLTKALIAFGMQAYYNNRLAAGQELFTTDGVSGGIRFDRAIRGSPFFLHFLIDQSAADFLFLIPIRHRKKVSTKTPMGLCGSIFQN
jgi:hypothetical protein